MKKLIFILSILCFQLSASTIDKHLTKAENLAGKTMDSLYELPSKAVNAVKDGTHLIDTSSNFKMIYNDITSGISAIATGLKVGAEHVYTILVKKYMIDGITSGLLTLLSIIAFLWFLNKKTLKLDSNSEFPEVFPVLIVTIILFGFVISGLVNLSNILNNIFNPEYEALKFILEQAKPHLK
mgnify:CR=1 FL=1